MTSVRVGITPSPREYPADFLLVCTLRLKEQSALCPLRVTHVDIVMSAACRWGNLGNANPIYPRSFARRTRPLRGKTNFLNQINVICPVQICLKEYSASRSAQITGVSIASRPTEGRFAIVTNVGQGMRWTRQRRRDT